MSTITDEIEPMTARHATPASPQVRAARMNWDWLGAVPYFLFTTLFMILPISYLLVSAFRSPDGGLTLDNIYGLASPVIVSAYWSSITLSLASAAAGTICGLLLAYAVILGGLPGWVRHAFTTFSGVAANFAGVPLAFAFIVTLGPRGVLTSVVRNTLDFNIQQGLWLFGFWGLVLVYLYFQMSLMLLIVAPALDGLRNEWREASESLGASRLQYWTMVGGPILAPSVLGCFLLLFANAFGTLVTAVALTGGNFNIVPILLFQQIRGNVLYNPGLGYSVALGMVIIMIISNLLYLALRARAERWQK